MTSLTGTQNFPIDIEDEETILVPPSKRRKRVNENEVEIISVQQNLEISKKIETKPESKHKKTSKRRPCATQKSLEKLLVKFTNLESRLEALENCLGRVSQVFLNTSVGLEPCKPENENSESVNEEHAVVVQDDENVSENVLDGVNVIEEHNSVNNVLHGNNGPAPLELMGHNAPASSKKVVDDNPQNEAESSVLNEVCFPNSHSSDINEKIVHVVDQNDAEVSVSYQASHINEFVSQDVSNKFGSAHPSISLNNITVSVINEGCNLETASSEALQCTGDQLDKTNDTVARVEDEEPIDIKWHLFDLTSFKREVNLHRDDHGRVLLFLSCALKKLARSPSQIAATSGVYIGDEFRNEFPFISEGKYPDVRIEAEIKAALFGIEMIKSLYDKIPGSLCLMVISSSQPLVKLMKARSFSLVYPQMFSCSCENADCNHAERRWTSTDPLGKSQRDTLPKLLTSLRGLQVHWCSVDRISDDEKKILEKYSTEVQASLNKYVAEIRKR